MVPVLLGAVGELVAEEVVVLGHVLNDSVNKLLCVFRVEVGLVGDGLDGLVEKVGLRPDFYSDDLGVFAEGRIDLRSVVLGEVEGFPWFAHGFYSFREGWRWWVWCPVDADNGIMGRRKLSMGFLNFSEKSAWNFAGTMFSWRRRGG